MATKSTKVEAPLTTRVNHMNTTIHNVESIKITEPKEIPCSAGDFFVRHLFVKTDKFEVTLTITSSSKDKLEITSYEF
jgi:desulfoferrodoxin (superoxide reductase-like protein)